MPAAATAFGPEFCMRVGICFRSVLCRDIAFGCLRVSPATTRRPVITPDPPLRNRFQPRLSDWMQRIRATGPLHLPDEDPIRPHTTTLLGDCNNLVAQIGTGPKKVPETHSSGVAHCGTPLNSYRLAVAKNDIGLAGTAGWRTKARGRLGRQSSVACGTSTAAAGLDEKGAVSPHLQLALRMLTGTFACAHGPGS